MPITTRGRKPSVRFPPSPKNEHPKQVVKKPRTLEQAPVKSTGPCVKPTPRGPNEETECMVAATRFLDFCREAWSTAQSSSPVQDATVKYAELDAHFHYQAPPLIRQRPSEGHGDKEATAAGINNSPRKALTTPPGFKVSTRTPKPGEPPLWGVFAGSSEPLKSPIRLRLRNEPKAIEASIKPESSLAEQKRIKFRASSMPIQLSTDGLGHEIVSVPPKGGTLMYTVKQNNKLKRLQRTQRPQIAPQKDHVGPPTMQKPTCQDRRPGVGLPGERITAEVYEAATI